MVAEEVPMALGPEVLSCTLRHICKEDVIDPFNKNRNTCSQMRGYTQGLRICKNKLTTRVGKQKYFEFDVLPLIDAPLPGSPYGIHTRILGGMFLNDNLVYL